MLLNGRCSSALISSSKEWFERSIVLITFGLTSFNDLWPKALAASSIFIIRYSSSSTNRCFEFSGSGSKAISLELGLSYILAMRRSSLGLSVLIPIFIISSLVPLETRQ